MHRLQIVDGRIAELGWPDLGIVATEYGLFVEDETALANPHNWQEFEAYAEHLQAMARGLPYCLGDFFCIAEMRWGEDYAQLASATGLDVQTLYNQKWVCSRVPYRLRIYADSFEHAKAVAALETEEAREAALRLAQEHGMTRDELRDYVRTLKGEEAFPQWSAAGQGEEAGPDRGLASIINMSTMDGPGAPAPSAPDLLGRGLVLTRQWLGNMSVTLRDQGYAALAEAVRTLWCATCDLLDKIKEVEP